MINRLILILLLVLIPFPAHAAIIWQTTFNCADWQQGQSFSCDSVGLYSVAAICGGSSMTAASNYPGGLGGKGFRIAIGDGINFASARPDIEFTPTNGEMYVRFYFRYAAGFTTEVDTGTGLPKGLAWHKYLYLNVTKGPPNPIAGFNNGSIDLSVYDTANGNRYYYPTPTWMWYPDLMPTGVSNGSWHSFEAHFGAGGRTIADGVFETWVDGVRVMYRTDILYLQPSGGGWHYIQFLTNQRTPVNTGGCSYIDIDDIVISDSRIGEISQNPPSAPTAPTNIR